MHIEVVTIGDELLLGYTIDTNAAHLARTLAADGVEIVASHDRRRHRRRRSRPRCARRSIAPAP